MNGYSKMILKRIDDTIVDSRLQVEFELINEYAKIIDNRNYYTCIYQEAANTNNTSNINTNNTANVNTNNNANKQQWTNAFTGNAGDGLFKKILLFLPRLIRDIVSSIGSAIGNLFSGKKVQETDQAITNIQNANISQEQMNEIITRLQKAEQKSDGDTKKAGSFFNKVKEKFSALKGKASEASQSIQSTTDAAREKMGDIREKAADVTDSVSEKIDAALDYVAAFCKEHRLSDKGAFLWGTFKNGVIPVASSYMVLMRARRYIDKFISDVKKMPENTNKLNEIKQRLDEIDLALAEHGKEIPDTKKKLEEARAYNKENKNQLSQHMLHDTKSIEAKLKQLKKEREDLIKERKQKSKELKNLNASMTNTWTEFKKQIPNILEELATSANGFLSIDKNAMMQRQADIKTIFKGVDTLATAWRSTSAMIDAKKKADKLKQQMQGHKTESYENYVETDDIVIYEVDQSQNIGGEINPQNTENDTSNKEETSILQNIMNIIKDFYQTLKQFIDNFDLEDTLIQALGAIGEFFGIKNGNTNESGNNDDEFNDNDFNDYSTSINDDNQPIQPTPPINGQYQNQPIQQPIQPTPSVDNQYQNQPIQQPLQNGINPNEIPRNPGESDIRF